VGRLERISDSRLATRVGRGDRRALAALYDRYFPGVYDFAWQTVAERGEAAAVTRETFVQARERLLLGVRPALVRAWLFALARENAIGALGSRRVGGRAPAAAPPVLPATMNGHSSQIDAGRLLRLLGRGPLDQSLLDLHLRRGLGAEELSIALSLDPAIVQARLSRLRRAFEQSVAVALLAPGGRSPCTALDRLLETRGRSYVSGRSVWQHARACASCQEVLRVCGATTAAIASSRLDAPPALVAVEVWNHIAAQMERPAASPAVTRVERGSPRRPRRREVGAAAVVVGAAAVAASVVMLLPDDPQGGAGRGKGVATALPEGRAKVAALPAATRATARPPDPLGPARERTFSWPPAEDAAGYTFVLYRGEDVIFTGRTRAPRLALPAEWRHDGRVQRLEPGTYRWAVWPIIRGTGRPAPEAVVAARIAIG
jgi:DNA-directed RNA polymerase specialized sigma24 family protein